MKYARENKKYNGIFSTPVTDYETHLKDKAKKSRSSRTKSDILRREMGKPEPSKQEKVLAEIIDITPKCKKVFTPLTAEEIKSLPSEDLWAKIKGGKKANAE